MWRWFGSNRSTDMVPLLIDTRKTHGLEKLGPRLCLRQSATCTFHHTTHAKTHSHKPNAIHVHKLTHSRIHSYTVWRVNRVLSPSPSITAFGHMMCTHSIGVVVDNKYHDYLFDAADVTVSTKEPQLLSNHSAHNVRIISLESFAWPSFIGFSINTVM